MKRMKRMSGNKMTVVASAAAAMIFGLGAAQAQVLNFDINGTNTAGVQGSNTYLGPGAMAAFPIGSGSPALYYWNPVNLTNNATGATINSISDSAGNLMSGVSFTLGNLDGSSSGTASPNVTDVSTMLNDWSQGGYNNPAATPPIIPGAFTFSGLKANTTYTLDLYSINGGGGDNGATTFTIGSSTQTATNTSPLDDSQFILNDNYVTFTGNTGANGVITGIFFGVNPNTVGYLDGAQLNAVPASSTPEPAALALMGVGGAALLLIRRKQHGLPQRRTA
ncbi:MAG: PEP-CTERM sorting domain-containing protein [Phycisphaerae bacterium]